MSVHSRELGVICLCAAQKSLLPPWRCAGAGGSGAPASEPSEGLHRFPGPGAGIKHVKQVLLFPLHSAREFAHANNLHHIFTRADSKHNEALSKL